MLKNYKNQELMNLLAIKPKYNRTLSSAEAGCYWLNYPNALAAIVNL